MPGIASSCVGTSKATSWAFTLGVGLGSIGADNGKVEAVGAGVCSGSAVGSGVGCGSGDCDDGSAVGSTGSRLGCVGVGVGSSVGSGVGVGLGSRVGVGDGSRDGKGVGSLVVVWLGDGSGVGTIPA